MGRLRGAARVLVPWALVVGYGGLFLGGVCRLVGEVLGRTVWPNGLDENTFALVFTVALFVLLTPVEVRLLKWGWRESRAYPRAFGDLVPRWSLDITRRMLGLLAAVVVAGLAGAVVLPGPEAAALAIGSSVVLRLVGATLVAVLSSSKRTASVASGRTD